MFVTRKEESWNRSETLARPTNRLQRTALRAAAEPARWADVTWTGEK